MLASFRIVSVSVSVIVVPLADTPVTIFSAPVAVFVTVKSSAREIKVSALSVPRVSEVVNVNTFVPAVATAPEVAASSVEAFTLGRTPSTTMSWFVSNDAALEAIGSVSVASLPTKSLIVMPEATARADAEATSRSGDV